ncbi:hypothetical protein AB6D34_18430 [Pectobacterium brasiliense]|uniref:Uncharacterized protein n=1 Tax=Pectobacterium brasiliense TaxID=180957 RepID=A0A433NBQ0_9GAMM|nr:MULTISPECIES: hypothetical protein [Pectobacterium]GKW29447.1 hypothetical protein PEC331060_26250 [Pectobacterium carotovorum subsp. carotovorum]MBN3048078.1 hypothetical protein [Pectobacterium brasiliense]MBN3057053.1 hypothetical protein [Pectobacterium brasiliense]MBN3077635.1 hypothetical protein [Pectobacterium brasiliense]MBN3082010.1 hypothetical protein [Pectobacterium polaris]
MKVKELQAYLSECDPESVVLIPGFETVATMQAAEPDLVIQCKSNLCKEDAMLGNRCVSPFGQTGESSVWIGWSKDYRSDYFLYYLKNPEA